MAKTIDEYLAEITTLAGGRDMSTRWYRDQVRAIVPKAFSPIDTTKLIRSGRATTRPTFGLMNLYMYDPKLKESLPYYDVFPLVVPVKKYANGFLGVNFHYLSVPLRLKLLERMDPLMAEGKTIGATQTSKIRFTQPCTKRYLAQHVTSRFLAISREDMMVACLLPVQRFKKESHQKVHSDSRRML